MLTINSRRSEVFIVIYLYGQIILYEKMSTFINP